MRIRRATDADLATLAALWRAFEVEVPGAAVGGRGRR